MMTLSSKRRRLNSGFRGGRRRIRPLSLEVRTLMQRSPNGHPTSEWVVQQLREALLKPTLVWERLAPGHDQTALGAVRSWPKKARTMGCSQGLWCKFWERAKMGEWPDSFRLKSCLQAAISTQRLW